MTNNIQLEIAPAFADYSLIDSGHGQRLEKWGEYIIKRPDPQAIWRPSQSLDKWQRIDAWYKTEGNGKGGWMFNKRIPDRWVIQYKHLKFYVHLTPFKHTGVFPEQAAQWDYLTLKIQKSANVPNILNLFAYTGGATLAASAAGARVTHLDSSRPALTWARENQQLSGLADKPIRWIPDDAIKFTAREIKRGTKYDGIIMDPPVYGHGPSGEKWDFYNDFPKLLQNCKQLLSDKPIFLIVNAYALSASSLMLHHLLTDLNLGGTVESGELALREDLSKRLLSTGIFARWSK